MRLALLAMAAALLMAAGTGCGRHNLARGGCQGGCGYSQAGSCGCGQCGTSDRIPPLAGNAYVNGGPSGPPTGAYAYPYYTVRGPRDFLRNEPPTIGR